MRQGRSRAIFALRKSSERSPPVQSAADAEAPADAPPRRTASGKWVGRSSSPSHRMRARWTRFSSPAGTPADRQMSDRLRAPVSNRSVSWSEIVWKTVIEELPPLVTVFQRVLQEVPE